MSIVVPNFAQIEGFLYFGGHFWIQNGRHSTPKWTPYGEVCLTTCKYPFPLKSLFIFSFLTIYFDFILAAILKFEKQRAQL